VPFKRPLPIFAAVVAVATGVALAGTGIAAAGPPAVGQIGIVINHAQPVSGQTFTGVTVIHLSQKIQAVDCDARIGGKTLPAQQQRFYAQQIAGPTAVTCAWKIPASSSGKLLIVNDVSVDTPVGTWESPVLSWRIK